MSPTTTFDARTALDALALDDDTGGGALLVVGTSAQARRDAVAALLDALGRARTADAPAPLVVRVGGARAGGSLADEIASSAESALRAAGAPGGLYDDPGGRALASLGGWLFRARAIGRRGLLIVLEEVDTWVDARGAHGADGAAQATLDELLDERARRPVSVLATARAADAGGGAALSSEHVARFATVHSLGGAPGSLARDPSALVGQLAGRSFSLAALRNALAGFLELPPGASDETVVVFTSPLAPPALGRDGAGDVLDWGRAEGASGDRTTPLGGAAFATSGAPAALGDGWSDAVRAAIDVRESVRVLETAPPGPRGPRQFERLFRDAASRLPIALESLARGERALGAEPSRLSQRGAQALIAFERAFEDYYAQAFDAWAAQGEGGARPAMLCDLPARIARAAAERNARGTALLVCSGLRMDAWLRFRTRVLPRVPGLVLLEEGTLWAARPSTPATQRELLARGLSSLGARLPPRDEPVAPRSFDEALRPRREHLGHTEVLRLDAWANAFERSRAAISETLEPVEAALPGVLLPLCGALAGRTVLAIAADVGVRDRGAGATANAARYGWGGDTPFEALLPFGLFGWG